MAHNTGKVEFVSSSASATEEATEPKKDRKDMTWYEMHGIEPITQENIGIGSSSGSYSLVL